MLSERLKSRLRIDRPMTSITLRIPTDVLESMQAIASKKGFIGYQTLLKYYLSEGLRRDEAQFLSTSNAQLMENLLKHGVAKEILEEAVRELNTA
ncbi:MAG: hypothetical protein RIR79_1974 [Pseudomonadota bacterium]|jgi:hypothetical protein